MGGMDAFAAQISLAELDPALAEQEARWVAAAVAGKPKCTECGHPLHAKASVDALAGPSCAAKVGRIVIAARNARIGEIAASRKARHSARRRRARSAA